jgi:3-oxoacyl-(acyl-carrier-protein) synthase
MFYSNEFAVLHEKGPRRVNPFLIPAITVDAAAVQVAIRTGAQGPNFGVASACASGLDAIGQSFEQIRLGYADAIFTGSFEAALMPIALANLDRMRALTHRNDDPAGASRPFDATRDGFVPAEGGALLILEELDYALRRGAHPLAEILSYAATSDAAHVTAPDKEGAGAGQCMKLAIHRARLEASQISYINAHGTGTPSGDPAETAAIKQALGDHAYQVPVSSTKSMTGHMMGGAGSFETLVCVQALLTGIVPPTINLHHSDPLCDLDYVPNQARCIDPQVVLTNSFGFGGHNATLALRRI